MAVAKPDSGIIIINPPNMKNISTSPIAHPFKNALIFWNSLHSAVYSAAAQKSDPQDHIRTFVPKLHTFNKASAILNPNGYCPNASSSTVWTIGFNASKIDLGLSSPALNALTFSRRISSVPGKLSNNTAL